MQEVGHRPSRRPSGASDASPQLKHLDITLPVLPSAIGAGGDGRCQSWALPAASAAGTIQWTRKDDVAGAEAGADRSQRWDGRYEAWPAGHRETSGPRRRGESGSIWGESHNCPGAEDPQVVGAVQRTNQAVLQRLGLTFGATVSLRDLVSLLRERVPDLREPGLEEAEGTCFQDEVRTRPRDAITPVSARGRLTAWGAGPR
jgi:hypothetical protein